MAKDEFSTNSPYSPVPLQPILCRQRVDIVRFCPHIMCASIGKAREQKYLSIEPLFV